MKKIKSNKLLKTIVTDVVIYVVTFVIGLGIATFISIKSANKLAERLDNNDRKIAIECLSELKGMIFEVKFLSYGDISQDILLNNLEEMSNQNYFIHSSSSPYLKNFDLTIPDTSNVGKICDELISQIDNQIQTIESDEKGE